MRHFMKQYAGDLGYLLTLDLPDFFDFVRKIPYLEDPPGAEILGRPAHLLDGGKFSGLDCKKKAILMGSYFHGNGIQHRIVAVSEAPDKKPHHVFNQIPLDGEWRNVDATYPDYQLFGPKHLTYTEVI